MRSRLRLLALIPVAACGKVVHGGADAPLAPDAWPIVHVDAAPFADASPGSPDAANTGPDAAGACGPAQTCMTVTPLDGTAPPPGRIAIAWVPLDSTTSHAVEIAYDTAWPAGGADTDDPVTRIDLAAIAPPTPPFQSVQTGCASPIAMAIVVLSTDPDGNGGISSDEVLVGLTTHTVYGIGQLIPVWTAAGCPPSSAAPDGLAAGVHAYAPVEPLIRIDGTVTTLQTCQPGAAICSNLNNPLAN